MFALSLQAQTPKFDTGKKTDPRIERILGGGTSISRRMPARENDKLNVILNATDAQQLAEQLQAAGHEAMAVGENTLTATLPIAAIRQLANSEEVRYIRTPRQMRLSLNTTRTAINVNSVHDGTGLDTPFDGTGVIVGVIDEGFEYKHAAFLDENGKTRVKRLWRGGTSRPTTVIPNGWDGFESAGGHATHTTNIAAGSKTGNNYYGIAPKADIYMMPSNLTEDEILQGLKYLADYSKSEGKPCVVNMSFGSQLGPHDGSTEFDHTANQILGNRFVACTAIGNEGDQAIHSMHKFSGTNQLRNIVFDMPTNPNAIYEGSYEKLINGIAVCSATDGEKHLTFRPFLLINGSKVYPTEEQFNSFADLEYTYEEVDPYNGHQQYRFIILSQKMLKVMNAPNAQFGLEITGSRGDVVHVWLEGGYGTVALPIGVSKTSEYLRGDNKYCVSEASSSIPQAIAVGAVDGSSKKVAYFSSLGPWLGDGNKPTVSAPGVNVWSAICKYGGAFDTQKETAVSVNVNGNDYYYGAMSGSSMSTPVVTGVVALWLQAYPDITHDELIEIFRTTSQHTSFNTKEWDEYYGYGIVDAYAGLKKALEMARVSGINETFNTAQPVSLKNTGKECRVLFNNDESFAEISVVSAAGQVVLSRTVEQPRRGEEQVVSLKDFTPGIYVLNIRTTSQQKSSKLLVR